MKTYILIGILILLVIYSFRGIYRNFTGKDSCASCGHDKKNGGCNCGGNCGSNCDCSSHK